MRILLTGGAGFIGSRVACRLTQEGHTLFLLDNFSSSSRPLVPTGVDVIECDVREREQLGKLIHQIRPEIVGHLAAQVSTRLSFERPDEDVSTNIIGTLNVVTECARNNIPRLILASSMVCYGNSYAQPISEQNSCAPVSIYGVTKYCAERLADLICTHSGRPRLTALRLFLTYGPGQSLSNPYQGVIAIFISRVLRGEPIVIFGDGEQTRDVIFVDDVADAWARVIAHDIPGIFNVGTGESHSINIIVDQVLSAFGLTRAEYPVAYEASSPGDQRHVTANIENLRALTGWSPGIDLETGIARTVKWAREAWRDGAAFPSE